MKINHRDEIVQVRIDEIVGALRRIAPETLDGLAREFPQEKLLLEPGLKLGSQPSWQLFAKISVKLLDSGIPAAETALATAKKRLRLAARLELAAQCVSSLGSACTAGLALGKEYDKTALLAVITLIGSLLALFVRSYRSSLFGGKSTLMDHYLSLTSLVPEMALAKAQIEAVLESNPSEEPKGLKAIVGRTNEMSRTLNLALGGI